MFLIHNLSSQEKTILSNDFYTTSILQHAGIIIKICRGFLSKFIYEDTSFIQVFGIGLLIAIVVAIVGKIAFSTLTKILYETLISIFDDIVEELEVFKN